VNDEARAVGQQERARELAMKLEKSYGALTLYPLAKRLYALDAAEYRAGALGAAELARTHPELVTSANWTTLEERTNLGDPPGDTPKATSWFDPLVPAGTAFDLEHRLFGPRHSLLAYPETLKQLRVVAPYETDPIFELLRITFGDSVPLAEFEREAGALAEYDMAGIPGLSSAGQPEKKCGGSASIRGAPRRWPTPPPPPRPCGPNR